MDGISFDTSEKTIQDIANLFKSYTKNKQRHLNLSPGFQRESVWTHKDRQKLIDSILRNYPIPAIFLYRREENGEIVYDVVDGKQRIETCLMFMGLIRGASNPSWHYALLKPQKHIITGRFFPAIPVVFAFISIRKNS